MNGPYRTAACVDASAEQHACSPALCCACQSCRSTSQLLARWLAEQHASPPPRIGLGARVSRAASVTLLGLVAGVLVVTIGLAAGAARSTHDARTTRLLLDAQRAAGQTIEKLQAEKRAAEQEAATLTARLSEQQPTSPDAASGGAHGGNGPGDREARLLLSEMSKRPIPWPPFLLGYSGPESHDPDVLLGRALRFVQDGLDLEIERTTLSPAELTEAIGDGSWPVLPFKHNDVVVGFVLDPARDAHDVSQLRRLGLERGDVITAVNGHPLSSPDRALEAYSHVRDRRKALFEIIRRQRRVVLLVQLR